MLTLTFALKPSKSKILGVILIVLGFITVLSTIGWGIVAYAVLIPAAIIALRYNKASKSNTDTNGGIVAGGRSGGGGIS